MLPSQRLKEWWYYPLTVDVDKPNHQQEKKGNYCFLGCFPNFVFEKKNTKIKKKLN
jgi:hypothetical protein